MAQARDHSYFEGEALASNPRIDDLRKRLEKEPGSRLFAQLAEELRKAGELDESIRVARDGLGRHANYPSARMTLGRALFDLGDLRAARAELEAVVASAPDNILACRLLGEALEGLGLRDQAAARYRTVLALAPGDAAVAARLAALALVPTPTPVVAAAPPEPPRTPVAPAAHTAVLEPLPAAVDAAPSAHVLDPEAPIPLVAVDDEDFELERPGETTARLMAMGAPAVRPFERADWDEPAATSEPVRVAPAQAPAEADFGVGREDLILDLDQAEAEAAPTIPFARATPEATADEVDDRLDEELGAGEEPASPDAVPALSSPTLAELYFSQGVPEKASAVYRQILEREPWNERARRRLDEIEARLGAATAQALAEAGAAEAGRPPATRREALERTIVRLEAFLKAVTEGRDTWPASPTP